MYVILGDNKKHSAQYLCCFDSSCIARVTLFNKYTLQIHREFSLSACKNYNRPNVRRPLPKADDPPFSSYYIRLQCSEFRYTKKLEEEVDCSQCTIESLEEGIFTATRLQSL